MCLSRQTQASVTLDTCVCRVGGKCLSKRIQVPAGTAVGGVCPIASGSFFRKPSQHPVFIRSQGAGILQADLLLGT